MNKVTGKSVKGMNSFMLNFGHNLDQECCWTILQVMHMKSELS